MTKALKCDCSASDAYVSETLTMPGTGWYIQADLAVPAATLAALIAATDYGTASLISIALSPTDDGFFLGDFATAASLASPTAAWHNLGGGSAYPAIFPDDQFNTVIAHYDGTNLHWIVNGTEIANYVESFATLSRNIRFGGWASNGVAGEIYYVTNVKIGTTLGGTDLFADDFSSGNTSAWTSTVGAATVVDDPYPPVPPNPTGASGVYIAFGDPTLTETPNYQPIVGVQAWNSDRGRQYELDKTQAGTCVVTVFDKDGLYDPSNPNSSLFGLIGPLAPAQVRIVNPVSGVTEPKFTGFVESWDYVLDITERWYILTLNLTDGFEPLNRAETVPDSTGTTVLAADHVNDRLSGVLADFGWPADKELIFSGNVILQETVYNPQTTLLSVLQDCADAELPNAANLFADKWGQMAFRGRFSRLIPAFYSPRIGGMTPPSGPRSVIRFWEVGDRQAADTFGIAPIAALEWTLDLKNVINAVICTPNGVSQSQIAGQLVEDAASIAQYGTRVLSISDLLTLSQVSDPAQGQLALDANDTCMIYGMYYVNNYAQPVEMISHIEFHTLGVADSLAGPLWEFIQGVEIGDVVKVWATNPGGGGFREVEFFVEGIHDAVKPLEEGVFDWTMTLDLSPRAWYSVFNGRTYYIPPAVPSGSVVAAFDASPCIGPASLHVDFTDQSVPGFSGPITAWHWDFGDGNTSSSQSPSHTFAAPTPPATGYTVVLTVTGTGSDGTSTRSQVITVR